MKAEVHRHWYSEATPTQGVGERKPQTQAVGGRSELGQAPTVRSRFKKAINLAEKWALVEFLSMRREVSVCRACHLIQLLCSTCKRE